MLLGSRYELRPSVALWLENLVITSAVKSSSLVVLFSWRVCVRVSLFFLFLSLSLSRFLSCCVRLCLGVSVSKLPTACCASFRVPLKLESQTPNQNMSPTHRTLILMPKPPTPPPGLQSLRLWPCILSSQILKQFFCSKVCEPTRSPILKWRSSARASAAFQTRS